MAAAVVASSLFWAFSVNSAQHPQLLPAGIVASRFPAEWNTHAAKSAAAFLLAGLTKAATPAEALPEETDIDLLSPVLLHEQGRPDAMATGSLATPVSFGAVESIGKPLPHPPTLRAASRAASLFNDAQIASIKKRLNLAADQHQLWAPVESALRAMAWRSKDRDSKSPTLDPKGVERLKTALEPFIKKLRADQKDELRTIAHLMGLEKMASYL